MSTTRFFGLSRYLVPAIVLISLVMVLIPASVVKADSVVTFPDPNLEAAIREAIGKPAGDIYESDLVSLTELWAQGRGIVDITGLQHCTSLTTIHIYMNQISDISPLAGLTSLEWLELSTNQLTDLSPLASLTSLMGLDLGLNQISDLSPLAGLTNLTGLNLFANLIADPSPLAGLTNLTLLDIGSNQISDLSPLAGLTSLTVLSLADNQIGSLPPLADLTGLTVLDISGNRVSDLSPLAGLTSLTYLVLWVNQISDLRPLAGLTGLEGLYVGFNQIGDLSPISGLSRLMYLFLDDNLISDIAPLSGLTSLSALSLRGNQVTDVGPLVNNLGVASGDYLDLRGNPLNNTSLNTWIPALLGREVAVDWDAPAPTETIPPRTPKRISPVYGAYVSSTPSFDWSDVTDPSGVTYELQIDNNSDYSSLLRHKAGLATSGYTLTSGEAMPDGVYYWRVRAVDGAGNASAWNSGYWQFVADTVSPGTPKRISPVYGATVNGTPSFDWSDVTDISGVIYELQIDDDSDYSSPVFQTGVGPGSGLTLSADQALPPGVYYWRVRAVDRAGHFGAWNSGYWKFTVDISDTVAPRTPKRISPVYAATVGSTPTLDWSDVTDPSGVSYELQIDNTSDYSSPLLTKVGLTSSQYTLTTGESLAPGVWYWRVRAVDGAGNASAWNGGYWKFIVV